MSNKPNDCDEHDHGRPEGAPAPALPWHKRDTVMSSKTVDPEAAEILRNVESKSPGQQVFVAMQMIELLLTALGCEALSKGRVRLIDPVLVVDTIGPLLDAAETHSGAKLLDAEGLLAEAKQRLADLRGQQN